MSNAYERDSGAEIKETIAANLAAELERQRWSHRKAAAALGLTQPYVSRRASGAVELTGSDFAMFSEFLKIPVSRFFTKLPDQDSNLEPAGNFLAPVIQITDHRILRSAVAPVSPPKGLLSLISARA